MTTDDEHAGLLTLVQHTVAVRNPGGGVMGLCPKKVKETEDPTPLSWKGSNPFVTPQASGTPSTTASYHHVTALKRASRS